MKIIVGNWKMHGDAAMARTLAQAVAAAPKTPGVTTVLCPPFLFIAPVVETVKGSNILVGAQNSAAYTDGAYTGDISATMLKIAGCSHVILGHSERRQYHEETNDITRRKAAQAIKAGLIPIICIGETDAERTSGKAEAVVEKQVTESLPKEAAAGKFILAYEPVWAIGTGKTPTADDIRQMHAYIKSVAAKRTGLAPDAISVLYGGSVKADNAAAIMAIAGVDGVLVGGASLKIDEFNKIIEAAKKG